MTDKELAAWRAGYLAGREDAAVAVETAWYEEPHEQGPIRYHAKLARGKSEEQIILGHLETRMAFGQKNYRS